MAVLVAILVIVLAAVALAGQSAIGKAREGTRLWEGKYERAYAVGELYRQWHAIEKDDAAEVRRHLFDALEQSRNLAQQLATIRVQHPGATPDDMGFTPTPVPAPYSEDLQHFLAGIMGDEARTMVEESIEDLRAHNVDDSEIFRRISGTENI